MNSLTKIKHFTRSLCLLLLLSVSTLIVQAQDSPSVTGRVSDEKGEFLIGATVMEKGTLNAVITDINGQYNLKLTTADPTLEISFTGFKTQEIRVNNKRVVDIVLVEDISTLDEVVVVGYGHQRKVSVVGAQSAMRIADIKMPTGNLSNAISGRIAGIVSVTRSGEPGHDDSDIWIRGMSTLSGQSSSPLVLVDGVERSLNNLDPEDVESLTVLKDASATAVYGVRGANGVIIIKTKPGKVGKPQFSVDYYESFTRMTKTPQMTDAYTYMDVANEAYANAYPGSKALYSPEYIAATKKAHGILPNDNPKMYNEYLYPAVNWMNEIFNDWGHNRRANMNIRGGVPNANYYVSLSYYNEQGQTKNFELENYNTKMQYNRFNFTSNLNLKPTSKTSVDLGFSGWLSSGHYPQQSAAELYSISMQINPVYLPLTMPDGSLSGINSNGDLRNPYMDLSKRGYYQEFNNQLNSNLRVTQDLDFWDWSKGLKISGMLAFDAYNSRKLEYKRWSDMYYFAGSKDTETGLWQENGMFDSEGNYNMNRNRQGSDQLSFEQKSGANRNTYLEFSLNYDRTFGKHRVSGLLLYNQKIYRDLTANNMTNSLAYKNRGYAARGTYSFDDRYLFEVNLGINGSENFSPDKRYGVFPAFGLGWVASNESFWKKIQHVVSYFKVRYTIGWVGSDAVTDRRFMYQGVMSGSSGDKIYGLRQGTSYGLTNGWGVAKYGVDVGWARARKQDLGIDINFLNDNLTFTFDLFKEYRDNIFLQRKLLPDYAGFVESPWANLGIVENKGFEIQAEYSQQLAKKVFLTVRGNLTYNKDKIIEDDTPAAAYPWLESRGTNVNARWGYIADGLFTSQEEIDTHATQFGTVYVGDIKYRDLNGDGRIDEDDKCVIGQGDVPKIYYGFGFDLQVHDFSIAALFQGTAKADRHLEGRSIHPFSGQNGLDNLYDNIDDRWSADDPTNTDVFYPRLTYTGESNTNNTQKSTWWQKDVSFLRLKQLTVSYRIPKKLMNKCLLKDGSIYLMGSNLFTLSKFKLWDPELNTNNGSAYPNTSSYSIGVKFSF
ncbi:TonB-dependent receptor [Bacteroides sp. 519]|uniref:SusC/RagA family TonB-linked outer membrane protein n=1 Tax=Bacteroides sp. 519 TaxID=2302937 RepID=UPI0013D43502|nr:TonB-dependent receptor [Bacteroides sp. 519]NDV56554.1 TonB-dependent receptor [Bacteroides sp. 519]